MEHERNIGNAIELNTLKIWSVFSCIDVLGHYTVMSKPEWPVGGLEED